MDAFLVGLGSKLAADVVKAAAGSVRRRFAQAEHRKALEGALAEALAEALGRFELDRINLDHYTGFLGGFFGLEGVVEELALLLDPRANQVPEVGTLVAAFIDAGGAPDLLPHFDLEAFLHAFLDGFYGAAGRQAAFQGVLGLKLQGRAVVETERVAVAAEATAAELGALRQDLRSLKLLAVAGEGGREADLARRYLDRLVEPCRYLPIAGFKTRVRMPIHLSDVYIPLRASVQHRVLEKEQRALGAAREWGEVVDADVLLDEVFARARGRGLRGAVILGDPGSGKTTLLKHFVLTAADPDGANRLQIPSAMLPVVVELRRLSDPGAGFEPALGQALRSCDIGLGEAEAVDLARWLLGRDGLLVLIDGLDEVADRGARVAVARWLEDAVTRLPKSFFVLTSRYAGYREESRLDGRFLELHVRDLSPLEARGFIDAWYHAVEEQAEGSAAPEVARRRAEEGAADLTDRLFESQGEADPRVATLADLVRNPLLLQIVCLVHRDRKNLPERRVELYDECVTVLLETWREAKKLPVRLTASRARKLLEPLAYRLHTTGVREATIEEILPAIEPPLRALGHAGQGEELLAALRDDSGLLVFLGQGTWGFLHLSFQEYLAACHVQSRVLDEAERLADLAGHFGEPWWREVLLLALGLERPSLFKPLLREILRRQLLHCDTRLAADCLRDAVDPVAEPFLEALAAGLDSAEERYHALQLLRQVPGWKAAEAGGVSGRSVVEGLRQDGDPQVRGLVAELVGVPAVRRAGRAPSPGEERIHEVDGSVLVFVPGGEYVQGAEGLGEAAKPVHKVTLSPFWIGKYPVMCQQYAAFRAANPSQRKPAHWGDKRFNQPRQPVVGVSWEDASAYCAWAGLALPSEARWEAAARGLEGRRFPWGNEEPTLRHANFGESENGPTPVGNYPLGAGPFGALDQAGNVWEWCEDIWDASAYRSRGDKKDPVSTTGEAAVRSLRGGAWLDPAGLRAAAYRFGLRATDRDGDLGFRVCLPLLHPSA